jgi:hypothetical protein
MPSSVQTQAAAPKFPAAPRPSRLLAGIYHDIGMAAVAQGLSLDVADLDVDALQSVQRGARYIHLMPRRETSAPRQAAE